MTAVLLLAAMFISPAEIKPDCSVARFEKSFAVTGRIVRATWSVSAQGVFEAEVNGTYVGDDFLKPGFVSVEKARHVYEYDVTGLLQRENGLTNRLSATVAPTWWCDSSMNERSAHRPGGLKPTWKLGRNVAFYGILRIDFSDGGRQEIGTDESWSAAYTGPVRFADLYDGEVYDARKGYEKSSAGRSKRRIHR